MAIWLYGCNTVWQYGYKVVWLHCYHRVQTNHFLSNEDGIHFFLLTDWLSGDTSVISNMMSCHHFGIYLAIFNFLVSLHILWFFCVCFTLFWAGLLWLISCLYVWYLHGEGLIQCNETNLSSLLILVLFCLKFLTKFVITFLAHRCTFTFGLFSLLWPRTLYSVLLCKLYS